MLRHSGWIVAALVVSGAISWGLGAGEAPAADDGRPAHLEDIPGSDLKRVVLTQKAAERLAIATAPVREEPVMRWMMVGGEVEALTVQATQPEAPESGVDDEEPSPVLVRVPLVDDENQLNGHATLVLSLGIEDGDETDDDDDEDDGLPDTVAQDTAEPDSALVLPVGGETAAPLKATQIAARPGADVTSQYYQVSAANYRLMPGQRVYVRVPQPDSGTPQKVVPYSAVIYDPHGNTWAYVNPEPLTYVRHPIDVEYIEGNLAVLKDGPEIGTPVVTVGAAELLGVEQNVGH